MLKQISQYKNLVGKTLDALDDKAIEQAAALFLSSYQSANTIYIFGNGGSGATASHICGDFIKGVSYGLDKRFKMICLNDNPAALMATANDISYDDIFIEPLKNFIQPGDLVIAISGSGNSTNVIKALEYAKIKGVSTIAFCGYNGGKIKELADVSVHAQVNDMEVTEDVHLMTFHIIKQILTQKLHGDDLSMGSAYDERVSI